MKILKCQESGINLQTPLQNLLNEFIVNRTTIYKHDIYPYFFSVYTLFILMQHIVTQKGKTTSDIEIYRNVDFMKR